MYGKLDIDFHTDSLIQNVWDNQIWTLSYKMYGTIRYGLPHTKCMGQSDIDIRAVLQARWPRAMGRVWHGECVKGYTIPYTIRYLIYPFSAR